MDAGGVQVQHQPSNQDPTRQSWRNNSSNSDQGKRGSNKSKTANLKSINVERAQNMSTASRNVYNNNNNMQGAASVKTPKTAQFPRQSQQQMSSPPQTVFVSRSPPKAHNLSRSPPKANNDSNVVTTASNKQQQQQQQQKTAHSNSRHTPKPLNLSKSSHNFGRVPQTATFPPKVNRALNLPNPPKTATLAKSSSGFPKDIRQNIRTPQSATIPQQAYAFIYGFLPEGYNGIDNYDHYIMPYEEEAEEGPYYYYYYDYPQEYIPPQTPTGTSHQQRSSTTPSATKDERRRSVFGGPMKVHPDAVLPIRQPKGPDMAKNFATRIRRKAVNKLYAAAAERRSKSAADRRKSALF